MRIDTCNKEKIVDCVNLEFGKVYETRDPSGNPDATLFVMPVVDAKGSNVMVVNLKTGRSVDIKRENKFVECDKALILPYGYSNDEG